MVEITFLFETIDFQLIIFNWVGEGTERLCLDVQEMNRPKYFFPYFLTLTVGEFLNFCMSIYD